MGAEKTYQRTESFYSLGQASKLSGISVYSIRQYIDKGLILPYVKSTKRHLFSYVDILRLKCIKQQISESGLNVAGIKNLYSMIPCWIINDCSKDLRDKCGAYYSDRLPCWEASRKGENCKNRDCRSCKVYRYPELKKNIKEFIKTSIEEHT